MQAHEKQCKFRKVECPFWPCRDLVTFGEVVEHVQGAHEGLISYEGNEDELIFSWAIYQQREKVHYIPGIALVHRHKFFFNCIKINHSTMFWVSISGPEEEAQKFEARITAGPNIYLQKMGIRVTGRVYSIEMSKDEVLQDQTGILEVSKNMTDKMGKMQDGEFEINTEFKIIRK